MRHGTDLKSLGEKLLSSARTELYLAMRFLGPVLMSLTPKMDMSVRSVGTDAASLYYHPVWLMNTFIEHPYVLNRAYLHTVMHCLFRHMYGVRTHSDRELWNLASDMAAEFVIDSIDHEAVRRTPSDLREEWHERITEALKVPTAERIYRYFLENGPGPELLAKLSSEFFADDHLYWERIDQDHEKDGGGSQELSPDEESRREDSWKRAARRVKSEYEVYARRAGKLAGEFSRMLEFDLKDRISYRELLESFAVIREEVRVDPDSFDYGFYHYGMELYGNMPLIEENEFAEMKKIRELVIAIDTSASCSDETLRRFLSETGAILLQEDSFFRKFELHIVECDAAVHEDIVITSREEMTALSGGISLKGGGGTDFRPVFRYVDDMKRKGMLRDLIGLVYFTDGFGTFPKEAPSYETAVVLPEDTLMVRRDIPDWVMEVYLT